MKILWAVRMGEPDWAEEVITEREDQIPAASEWARSHGFDRLRVATVDPDAPPDFISAIQI